MQLLRIRFNLDKLKKEEDFYRINLLEYNIDDIKSVYIDSEPVGFYFDVGISELGISCNTIDLDIKSGRVKKERRNLQDRSIYINYYSVVENRNIQLEKLNI